MWNRLSIFVIAFSVLNSFCCHLQLPGGGVAELQGVFVEHGLVGCNIAKWGLSFPDKKLVRAKLILHRTQFLLYTSHIKLKFYPLQITLSATPSDVTVSALSAFAPLWSFVFKYSTFSYIYIYIIHIYIHIYQVFYTRRFSYDIIEEKEELTNNISGKTSCIGIRMDGRIA